MIPSTGNVDGVTGDMVLLAPSFNSTLEELEMIVDKTAIVIESVLGV